MQAAAFNSVNALDAYVVDHIGERLAAMWEPIVAAPVPALLLVVANDAAVVRRRKAAHPVASMFDSLRGRVSNVVSNMLILTATEARPDASVERAIERACRKQGFAWLADESDYPERNDH